MNPDLQTIRQLADATLGLLAQNNAQDLDAASPQVQKWKQVCTETVAAIGHTDALQRLRDALKLGNEALASVALLALPQLDSAYADVFQRLSAARSKAPNLDLLTSMVTTAYADKSALLQKLDSRSPLFYWKYLRAKGKGPLASRSLSLDPTLIACLNGTLDEVPGNLLSYWPGSPLNLKADADLQTTNAPLQVVSGGGSPERQLTAAINLASRFFKMPLYRVNTELLQTQDGPAALQKIFSFATLKKAALYWQEGLQALNAHPEYVPQVDAWLKIPGSVLFAGEDAGTEFPQVLDPLSVSTIHLAPLDDADKTQAWKNMGYAFLGSNAVDWEQCAQRYSANVARIGKALQQEKQATQSGEAHSAASVMDSYLKTSPSSIGNGLAQLQSPQGPVSEMTLGFSVLKELHALSDAFLNRAKLKDPVTPGVMCILRGAPGIGKTMAAHALAADLRLPLYQVNYSKAVDASAADLDKLFAEGEQNSAALLFDEADVLFAAKGDAEKPAQQITAYLIQKAESYPGLTLLTTNEPDKIDPAFLRRARVVSFAQLTPAQRISLMQKTATQNNASFHERVNLQQIATAYQLTPRHIARMIGNAVLSARANTTPSGKTVITSDDVKNALQYELK